MRKPVFAVVLVVAALGRSAAQAQHDSWDNLRQLRPGEDIEIVDVHMKSHRGRFASYTQDAVAVRRDGGDISIARAGVASVKRRRESHRRRNALAGLAIGAAGGLAVGAVLPAGGEVTVYRAGVLPRR